MPARTCAQCGVTLPTPVRGRPRTKCMSCSPPRERDKRRRADVVPITPDAPPDEPDGPVTRSTLDVLTRAERVTTPSGQVALALARRIDKAADSGSSLAALARQLSETMTEALVGVVLEPDKVDELRARRDAKLRGA